MKAPYAEAGGFEPPVRLNPYVSLANWWFQPLTQTSFCAKRDISSRIAVQKYDIISYDQKKPLFFFISSTLLSFGIAWDFPIFCCFMASASRVLGSMNVLSRGLKKRRQVTVVVLVSLSGWVEDGIFQRIFSVCFNLFSLLRCVERFRFWLG